jgi:hypothetical protein
MKLGPDTKVYEVISTYPFIKLFIYQQFHSTIKIHRITL